jgi:hypothetical protein
MFVVGALVLMLLLVVVPDEQLRPRVLLRLAEAAVSIPASSAAKVKNRRTILVDHPSKTTQLQNNNTKQGKRKTKKRRDRTQRSQQYTRHNASTNLFIMPSGVDASASSTLVDHISNSTSKCTITQQTTKNKQIKVKQPKVIKTTPWIEHFVLSHSEDALLRIPRDFIEDNFNLHNLPQMVEDALLLLLASSLPDNYYLEMNHSNNHHNISDTTSHIPNKNNTTSHYLIIYRAALKMILDTTSSSTSDNNVTIIQSTSTAPQYYALIQMAAKIIYCYAHARFVSSQRGLDTVHKMLMNGTY